MTTTIKTLLADTWVLVLQNTTKQGQVHILDVEEPDPVPTGYLVALVDTDDPAPASDFEGGVRMDNCQCLNPSALIPSDYYMKAVGADGKVSILS